MLSESSFDMTAVAYVGYGVFTPTLRAVPHEARLSVKPSASFSVA